MPKPMIVRLGVPLIAGGLLIIGAAAPALAAPPSASIPGVQVAAEDSICKIMVGQVGNITKVVKSLPDTPLEILKNPFGQVQNGAVVANALVELTTSLTHATSIKCEPTTLDTLHDGILAFADVMIAKADVLKILPVKAPMTALKAAVVQFAKSQGVDYSKVLAALDKVIAEFPF